MKKDRTNYIVQELEKLYPNAKCELNHRSHFQLLIAVVLSAQTTDQRVNMVTPTLFKKYKDAKSLSKADLKDVESIIKSIGLYHNKAINIIELSKVLVKKHDGKVPKTREELEALPGVGRKTTNVILSNCFNVPAFAVDTHVARVSKRLGIAKESDEVYEIEMKINKTFDESLWCHLHHQFIFFGRYKCKAKNPECDDCPFIEFCRKKD